MSVEARYEFFCDLLTSVLQGERAKQEEVLTSGRFRRCLRSSGADCSIMCCRGPASTLVSSRGTLLLLDAIRPTSGPKTLPGAGFVFARAPDTETGYP